MRRVSLADTVLAKLFASVYNQQNEGLDCGLVFQSVSKLHLKIQWRISRLWTACIYGVAYTMVMREYAMHMQERASRQIYQQAFPA